MTRFTNEQLLLMAEVALEELVRRGNTRYEDALTLVRLGVRHVQELRVRAAEMEGRI